MITALLGSAICGLAGAPDAAIGFCFLGLVSAALCAQRGRIDHLVRRWQQRSSAQPRPPGTMPPTADGAGPDPVARAVTTGNVLAGFGMFLQAGTTLALAAGYGFAALFGPLPPSGTTGPALVTVTAATVVVLALIHDTPVLALARLAAATHNRLTRLRFTWRRSARRRSALDSPGPTPEQARTEVADGGADG